MDKLIIQGGVPLDGEVRISGAKNAALPILCAGLLAGSGTLKVGNVPHLHDVTTMIGLLVQMGMAVSVDEKLGVDLDAQNITNPLAPYELVKTMRASILVLGPLLARFGRARVSLPGGCAIGSRPVDLHIKGLEAMGAKIAIEHGYIDATASRLKGARFFMDMVTATGTENLMMAATLAEGTTVLENAAREPEVVDLAQCLNAMGANIEGAGTRRDRDPRRRAPERRILRRDARPHRGGHLPGRRGGHLRQGQAEERAQRRVRRTARQIARSRRERRRRAGLGEPGNGRADQVGERAHRTLPRLPDRHAGAVHGPQHRCTGRRDHDRDHLREPLHARPGAAPAGADIEVEGNTAIVRGVTELSGATVMATDLRASASLVIAGLLARGETVVERIYHLDRGYECIEEKLSQLGARIRRVH